MRDITHSPAYAIAVAIILIAAFAYVGAGDMQDAANTCARMDQYRAINEARHD